MPKPKLTPEEYQSLKNFIGIYCVRFMNAANMPAEDMPLAILDKWEKTAPKRAMDGLVMAVNDCLEMSSGWEPEKVAAFDSELKADGIVTLTELRHQYSKQYARVMKRGSIKDLEEYYLVKGILDGGSIELSLEEQRTLTEIIDAFEKKVVGNQ